MRTFCTIISSDYFPYAVTLYRSLIRIHSTENLKVLVCDEGPVDSDAEKYPGIEIFRIKDIYSYSMTDRLYSKYGPENMDALRWSLKPVFTSYLLNSSYEKVIFTDCDLFFYNDYTFLFDALDQASLILTPGRTTRDPEINEEEFLTLFRYGVFNAGFTGASKKAIPALQWWANACTYRIEINFSSGLYNDQKYLDALPVLFDNIGIIRHRGCNIAFWNQHECKRVLKNGEVFINGEYPIVFIHFTNKYIPEILAGNDPLLLPYFRDYEKIFKQSGYDLNEFIPGMPEYKEPSVLIKLKRKLLIRTRIKRWLFKLSRDL
jgi:hypothetical protein